MADISKVIQKFFFTSLLMGILPIAILYGFNHHIFPGTDRLSSSTHTLLSGIFAVISVNAVIAFYIVMAMKERPTGEPQPDPRFLSDARDSIARPTTSTRDQDTEIREKEE